MADHTILVQEEVDILLARATWPDTTPGNRRALKAWIGDSSERASLVAAIQSACHTLSPGERLHRADIAWDRMQIRLMSSPAVHVSLQQKSTPLRILFTHMVRTLFHELPSRAVALIEGRDTGL